MRYAQVWTEARISAIRDITPTIRMFEFAPQGGALPFAVGSHINVGVIIDGQPDTRSYSLVGEPGGDRYRIAVKRHADSRGGSDYLWSLPDGARLSISHPQSLFTIDYGRPEYLLIAGGIGITPIVGMALQLARRGENVRLAYAVRSRADLAFGEELAQALGPRLDVYVSGEGRRLDVSALLADLGPAALVAACGPLPLLDDVRRVWAALGRSPADLRFETFGSGGHRAPEPFRVRLSPQGREILVPENQSMLDALNEAGIEIISDCLRGECGLCAVDILAVEGEVDHRDVFLSEAEQRENHKICTCVSRAVGAITIDTAYRPDQV